MPPIHAVRDLRHGQDLDIPAVARLNKLFQHLLEHAEALRGFRQIVRVQTEMEDTLRADCCLEAFAEAFDTGSQRHYSRSGAPDRIEEKRRWNIPKTRQRRLGPDRRRASEKQFIGNP
jgi:hypothetical protein